MSYQRRKLEIEFTLAEGTFDEQSGNILTVSEMKCELSISAYGGITGTTLDLRLYGLSLDYMAKLTGKSQRNYGQKRNMVKVKADGETVFIGTIFQSRINLNSMPDAPIEISANTCIFERTIPCADTSVQGQAAASSLVQALASFVGFKFVNVDVEAIASSPHYSGDAIAQIQQIANDYNFIADIDLGTVVIYTGKKAIDKIVPKVSPGNGLIGYPVFYDAGINFTCIFSSAIKVCRNIELTSGLPNASGKYYVTHGTTHYLSSWVEGGPWYTMVTAYPLANIGG